MDRARIRGGNRLVGRIPVSGAKNAALPLMAAALLTDEPLILDNVPRLSDTGSMRDLLASLGTEVDVNGSGLRLSSWQISDTEAPYDVVRKMRASILVLGPLLARSGQARVSLPGGCAIGNRPVDLHIRGLQAMGARVDVQGGYIDAALPASGRLRGARIAFPVVSVGATENLMMAAVLARGETELVNAAREPEISDLGACLTAMGARIDGCGTSRIHIQGVDRLSGATHAVLPDRIEAGTYAIAACMTGGDLELVGVGAGLLDDVLGRLRQTGAVIAYTDHGVRVIGPVRDPQPVKLATAPHPGFPTDLQAQMMAYMTRAKGVSEITETIFENRFMHVPELRRMGAEIEVRHSMARIRGVPALNGAPVMATDLRASVSLVLAGLIAEGETTINRIYHLDRGYERLIGKLRRCGAVIERVAGSDQERLDRVESA